MQRVIFPFVLFCFMLGCNKDHAVDSKTEKLGRPSRSIALGEATPSPEAAASAEAASAKTFGLKAAGQNSMQNEENGPAVIVTGIVKETIDVSRYTYLRLAPEDGEIEKEIWVAVPHAEIPVGRKVDIVQSILMKDFESKTLGRVFPSIVFGVLKEN